MEQHLALINTNGSTVKDVPAKDFIKNFAEHLKRKNLVKIPEWAGHVKTACWKELAPYDSDWLYTRAASVMYQLYMRKKIGTMGMRKHYGGGARNGTCKKHSRHASGKNIRYVLECMTKANLVSKLIMQNEEDGAQYCQGKTLSKKGFQDMDRIAYQIVKSNRAQRAADL